MGIKFSRLTRDEFSPRKLSGVFRVGLMSDVLTGFVAVRAAVVDGTEFQGFVELEFVLLKLLFRNESLLLLIVLLLTDVDVLVGAVAAVPKKSPNGSLNKSFVFEMLLLIVLFVLKLVGDERVVARFEVNKSKSSILFCATAG